MRASFSCEKKGEKSVEDNSRNENIIYGRNAVLEALKSEREFDKIFIKSGEKEGSISLIMAKAKERRIPILDAPQRKLDDLASGGVHQGVVAVLAEVNYASVEDILENARNKGESPFIVICDGISDPHNLGAVIRSAECAGAHGIIIPKRRSAGVNGTVVNVPEYEKKILSR